MNTKVMTIRLSEAKYARIAEIAKSRGTSINRVVEHSLDQLAESERKAVLAQAFADLAEEESDVDGLLGAASEVVLRD